MMVPSDLMIAFAQGGEPSTWMSFLPIILIFVIFYFLLVAPMRKRQKALERMIQALKKGDRVITSGGLHGEVSAIDGPTLLLKIADNVKVRVSKSAVTAMEGEESQEKGQ